MNCRADGRNTPMSVILSPFQSPVIGISVLSPKVTRVTGVVLKMNCRADGRNTPMSVILSPFQSPVIGISVLQPESNPCDRGGIENELPGRRAEYSYVSYIISIPVTGYRDIGVQPESNPCDRGGIENKLPGRRAEYSYVSYIISIPVTRYRDISRCAKIKCCVNYTGIVIIKFPVTSCISEYSNLIPVYNDVILSRQGIGSFSVCHI